MQNAGLKEVKKNCGEKTKYIKQSIVSSNHSEFFKPTNEEPISDCINAAHYSQSIDEFVKNENIGKISESIIDKTQIKINLLAMNTAGYHSESYEKIFLIAV